MSYIIEINEDGSLTLILPNDDIASSSNISEILRLIKVHYEENIGHKPNIKKLFEI